MAKQLAVLYSASKLHLLREEPKFSPLEIPYLKPFIINGLDRGAIVEIHGARSSGRTSICWHILAQATGQGEICAVVDWNNSFHPASAAAACVQLDRLVWVRCGGKLNYAIRATDLLLHAGALAWFC
jgi:RecA/RadA recombinase